VVELPAADYLIEIDSTPPQRIPVTLHSEEGLAVQLDRTGSRVAYRESRRPAAYHDCTAPEVPPGWQPLPAGVR
jgi:hypothetical protein